MHLLWKVSIMQVKPGLLIVQNNRALYESKKLPLFILYNPLLH